LIPAVAIVGSFVVSLVLSGVFVTLAKRVNLWDIPGERSMHTRPTPRGGGLAIAVIVISYVAYAGMRGDVSPGFALSLGVGGSVVAVVGLLDDFFKLRNGVRMVVWTATAASAVYWLGGIPTLSVGTMIVPLGPWGNVLAVVGIVWMVNLYNFMDGLDGLAAGQAVVVAAGAAILLFMRGAAGLGLVALVLAAAAAGFLVWNWPPARIFLGDVGSGFIGYSFAILAMASDRGDAVPLVVWAILLAPFLIDATLTVVRRVVMGERWQEAHKTHAYQRAVEAGRTHQGVTQAFLLAGLGLWGIAWLALTWIALTIVALVIVLLSLSAVWWQFAVRRVSNLNLRLERGDG